MSFASDYDPFGISYLRLYTTMPVSKMAAFLEMSEEDFRTHLLCFKHKMKNVVWTKGTSGLDGELQSGSEVTTKRITSKRIEIND